MISASANISVTPASCVSRGDNTKIQMFSGYSVRNSGLSETGSSAGRGRNNSRLTVNSPSISAITMSPCCGFRPCPLPADHHSARQLVHRFTAGAQKEGGCRSADAIAVQIQFLLSIISGRRRKTGGNDRQTTVARNCHRLKGQPDGDKRYSCCGQPAVVLPDFFQQRLDTFFTLVVAGSSDRYRRGAAGLYAARFPGSVVSDVVRFHSVAPEVCLI